MKDPADSPVLAARPTHVRHFVLAALCLITTINYLQRNSLPGAETTIRRDLGLDITDTGDAISGFFLTYALCQVPSGWLAQRWGGKRALVFYAAGWSVMTGLCGLVRTGAELVADRWAMGALQAGVFPCATMILATWYPATRRGFASAVLTSFMMIGGVIAAALTGLLIGPLGWRGLFLVYAVPGLLWAGWFAWWFRNRPQDHPDVNPAELELIRTGSLRSQESGDRDQESGQKPQSVFRKGDAVVGVPPSGGTDRLKPGRQPPAAPPGTGRIPWGRILLSTALWWICVQQFCRAGALRFFDSWLPTYLQKARGLTAEEANLWTGLPLWTGVLGSLLGGTLSDLVLARTGSRRAARQGVAVGSLLLGLVIYGLAYQVESPGRAVAVAGVGLCVMSFSSPCAYALTMDMGARYLAVVFATMNMAGNLGSWAFTKFIPRIINWAGGEQTRQGWDAALAVFAGLHGVAVLCWLLINPNGTIGEQPTAAEE